MHLVNVCGHSFLRGLLCDKAIVLDCGANHGDFSGWISNNLNAVVHAFEPDPRLFSKLPPLPRVHFYPLAVSGSGRSLRLMLGEARCSTACFCENPGQQATIVDSVRLDQFCLKHSMSRIDLIKMDVEGAEIGILASLSNEFLSNVGQLTVEFHDFIQKNETSRIRNVILKLKNAGFFYIRFSFFDYADVLFINKNIHHLSWSDISLICGVKYLQGLRRMVRRKFNLFYKKAASCP